MKLPQCGSNFKRSWLPCEVKSAFAGLWDRTWKSLCYTGQTKIDWCTFPRLRAYDAQTSAACQAPKGIFFFLHRMLQTFGTNFGFASACSVASALFEFILDHFGGLDAYSLSMSGNTWPPVWQDHKRSILLHVFDVVVTYCYSVISHCITFYTSQYQMMVNFTTNEISTWMCILATM